MSGIQHELLAGGGSADVPSAVTDFAGTNNNGVGAGGYVILSWSAPADNGSPITGYKIVNITESVTTTVGASTSKTLTGQTAGTALDFKIIAVNAIGDSPDSNEITVAPLRGFQAEYRNPGTYTWYRPTDSHFAQTAQMCGYAMAGGGGGGYGDASAGGGGGGGSATRNNLHVNSGSSLTISVGSGGNTGTRQFPAPYTAFYFTTGNSGQQSYIYGGGSLTSGNGGNGGGDGYGYGGSAGQDGGSGGAGGNNDGDAGGGGAGGFQGGTGGRGAWNFSTATSGGAGAGGGGAASGGGGGGGAGAIKGGNQGGQAGQTSGQSPNGQRSTGGPGGLRGDTQYAGEQLTYGGTGAIMRGRQPGGGGGGGYGGGRGGHGGVRLMWGPQRQYPNNNTYDY